MASQPGRSSATSITRKLWRETVLRELCARRFAAPLSIVLSTSIAVRAMYTPQPVGRGVKPLAWPDNSARECQPSLIRRSYRVLCVVSQTGSAPRSRSGTPASKPCVFSPMSCVSTPMPKPCPMEFAHGRVRCLLTITNWLRSTGKAQAITAPDGDVQRCEPTNVALRDRRDGSSANPSR